ncbi:MAG: 4-(cytidine 5'-diphospho)-2-C-methyl-D-erythritol kinase [Spirochaetales bacterium]|nr:4-(cytidine 5'-diphospho)-2-C-methyl-D-erythritol kinase [Spirochaetales bacterium]
MTAFHCARIQSPAKVNLHLDILGTRQDGFHDIRSLFVMTTFSDTIEIEALDQGSGFELKGFFSCTVEDNLITKAVRLFCRNAGISCDFRVSVEKRIPEGAGLGGGSSNAAAVLRVLDKIFPDAFSKNELCTIAAELGSDVPFFLSSTSAIVEGRGELVTPVFPRDDYHLLLILPDIRVNTAMAYKWFDAEIKEEDKQLSLTKEEIKKWYMNPDPVKWPFFNTFYPVIKNHHPEYRLIEELCRTMKVNFTVLSGSGACFAGVFTDQHDVDLMAQHVVENDMICFAARPLVSMPEIEFFT